MNKAWHAAHKMPARPSMDQRLAWYREHAKHCGCREPPEAIRKLMPEPIRKAPP
jgi:hypothetical protein